MVSGLKLAVVSLQLGQTGNTCVSASLHQTFFAVAVLWLVFGVPCIHHFLARHARLIEQAWVDLFCARMIFFLSRIFWDTAELVLDEVVSGPEFGLAYNELLCSLEW